MINREGALIASAKDQDNARTTGAIVANIWADYDAISPEALVGGEELGNIIIQGASGTIVAVAIGVLALCVEGNGELGRLIETTRRLKEVLDQPLQRILSESQ